MRHSGPRGSPGFLLLESRFVHRTVPRIRPVFVCTYIYLRAQSKASQATPTYVNTPVASPIRGNGAEIMAARASMRKRKE